MRIFVADDNEVVRQGVLSILSARSDLLVCGQAKDGTEAIQKARELRPDIILLDISMPGANGLEVARILRAEIADAKILIMSQHDPSFLLPRALEAGANACIDKSDLTRELLSIIDAVAGLSGTAPSSGIG